MNGGNMMDNFGGIISRLLNRDNPFLRKLVILRCLVCTIILFIAFCDSYWNVLSYIDFPCAPLLPENYRILLHKSVEVVFIIWLVLVMVFKRLYIIFDDKYHMKLSYVHNLVDYIITIYFLLYAINLGIEYANGLNIEIKVKAFIAFLYIIYRALSKSYASYRIEYERNQLVKYTGYCDSEGNPIPIQAKVFYRGKEYKVMDYEGIYRLLPKGYKKTSSRLMKLEDAASDMEGKLFVHNKQKT